MTQLSLEIFFSICKFSVDFKTTASPFQKQNKTKQNIKLDVLFFLRQEWPLTQGQIKKLHKDIEGFVMATGKAQEKREPC